MDRKATSLITAAAALAGVPAVSQAQPLQEPAVPAAASYADLLDPVPNSVERLKAVQAEAASRPARLIEAQYWNNHRHHHHHHSNYWYRQRGYYWNGGGWIPRNPYYGGGYATYYGGGYAPYYGGGYAPYYGGGYAPYYHHHHHHHHHNNY